MPRRDIFQPYSPTWFYLALRRLLNALRPPFINLLCSIYSRTSDNMDDRTIIGSCNVNSFNSFNSFSTTITDDRNQVLQWLSPLEPRNRHQHLRGNRLEGVGQWIFRTNEFRRWDTRGDGSLRRTIATTTATTPKS